MFRHYGQGGRLSERVFSYQRSDAVERPEIVEILIESLHRPPAREQRVAYTFLREIAVRRDEPFIQRSRVLLHLALYQGRRIAALTIDRVGSAIHRFPRSAHTLAFPIRDAALKAYRSSRQAIVSALIVAVNGYFRSRDALTACIAGTIAVIAAARATIVDTAAALASVLDFSRRRLYGAVNAFCVKCVDTVKTAFALVLFTAVGAYTAARNAVHTAYVGAIGIVVHSAVRTRDAARFLILRAAFGIARIRASVKARSIAARDAILTIIVRIIERVMSAYRRTRAVYIKIKAYAMRQVLPQGATPFIAAALVCLVLFVFGINSYFVVSDTNKKGIFIDLSRYEWGDEALASILIGEGYDIYLNEKITEKRIRELLASGQYYERIIRVTGYYSPLPDQNKYATGSYRGDIILNGRGIMGSDTTPVYIGMAAGPPHMEFGTNVIIEDLGKFNLPKIYTVHDRGGAINGNRLDIWVGKGEEAMEKAYKITGYYNVIVVGDK